MKKKLNFSVSAIIRKDKKKSNGKYPLYLQIILNSKPVKFPLGISEGLKDWDDVKKRFKGKGYQSLNNRLDKEEQEAKDFINQSISGGKPVNIEIIKSYFKKENFQDFYVFFEKVFCPRRFSDIVEGTQEHYKLLGRILKEFRPNLNLYDINLDFIQDFDLFLKVQKKMGIAGIRNKHKNLKAIINLAKKLEYIDIDPYNKFSIIEPKSKTHFLSQQEIERVKALELEGSLEITRDSFLFSCYTGLRFSDVEEFSRKNWGNNMMITKLQKKTGEVVKIPITKNALKLIVKYQKFKRKDEPIFNTYENATTNRHLKDIAEQAGVNLKLSFHWGRHTFGSLLAQNGVDAITIMRLLGHKNIRQSLIYVNSNDSMLKDRIKNIDFFNQ